MTAHTARKLKDEALEWKTKVRENETRYKHHARVWLQSVLSAGDALIAVRDCLKRDRRTCGPLWMVWLDTEWNKSEPRSRTSANDYIRLAEHRAELSPLIDNGTVTSIAQALEIITKRRRTPVLRRTATVSEVQRLTVENKNLKTKLKAANQAIKSLKEQLETMKMAIETLKPNKRKVA